MRNREIVVRIGIDSVTCEEGRGKGKVQKKAAKVPVSAKKTSSRTSKKLAKKKASKTKPTVARRSPAKAVASRKKKRQKSVKRKSIRKLPSAAVMKAAAQDMIFAEIKAIDPSIALPRVPKQSWMPANASQEKEFEKVVESVAKPILADAKKHAKRSTKAKKVASAVAEACSKPVATWISYEDRVKLEQATQAPLWEDIEPAPAPRQKGKIHAIDRLRRFGYRDFSELQSDLIDFRQLADEALADGKPITDEVKEVLDLLESNKEAIETTFGFNAWERLEKQAQKERDESDDDEIELSARADELEREFIAQEKADKFELKSIKADLSELKRLRNPKRRAKKVSRRR